MRADALLSGLLVMHNCGWAVVRRMVVLQVTGLRQNAVELLGGVASTKEVLHLATAGMPLLPAYQLLSGPGTSHVSVGHPLVPG